MTCEENTQKPGQSWPIFKDAKFRACTTSRRRVTTKSPLKSFQTNTNEFWIYYPTKKKTKKNSDIGYRTTLHLFIFRVYCLLCYLCFIYVYFPSFLPATYRTLGYSRGIKLNNLTFYLLKLIWVLISSKC